MPVRRHPIAATDRAGRMAHVPLDAALIARLRMSYERIRASDTRLADIFYERLFAAAPQLRPMFRSDPGAQAKKLMASLDAIVRNLEAPGENAAMLAELGRRHSAYGAAPAHYDLVIDLLVSSIGEVLGPQADARSLDEWRTALRLVSDQMIAASG